MRRRPLQGARNNGPCNAHKPRPGRQNSPGNATSPAATDWDGFRLTQLAGGRLVRPESILCCSKIPNHWRSGSTSAERQAPTAVEVAAASPKAAGGPTVPNPPDHSGLPDLASRGSGSSPSRKLRPTPSSIDHQGTNGSWAQRAGPRRPRAPGPQAVRKQTPPTHLPPAGSWIVEPALSFGLQSPSPKNFLRRAFKQVAISRRTAWSSTTGTPASKHAALSRLSLVHIRAPSTTTTAAIRRASTTLSPRPHRRRRSARCRTSSPRGSCPAVTKLSESGVAQGLPALLFADDRGR